MMIKKHPVILKLNGGKEAKFIDYDICDRAIYKIDLGEGKSKLAVLIESNVSEEMTLCSFTHIGEPDCPFKHEYQPQIAKQTITIGKARRR